MHRTLRPIICFWLLLFAPAYLLSEIVEASTFAEVEQAFKGADQHSLGVFDIDDVLTYSAEPAFQRGNWRENQQFVKCFLKALNSIDRWLFVNFSLIQAKQLPVDKDEWVLIKRLQEKKVKVIALTGMMTGLLGDVYLPDWRYEQLKNLRIDFSTSFPNHLSFCFDNLAPFLGRHPMFYKGILMANGELRLGIADNNKGDVLVEFLRRIDWKPKSVIFVDDALVNLQAVEKSLSLFDPDIHFTGVHFVQTPPHAPITSEELERHWNDILKLMRIFKEKNSCTTVKPYANCP